MTRRNTHSRSRILTGVAGSLALAAALAAPVLASEHAGDVAVETATDDLGTYLVDAEGMTLYYFTRDVTPGQSVCFGGCLEAWPPLLIGEGEAFAPGAGVSGTLGAVERDDGTMHVTYRGRPLYYWQGDTAPGETNGEGVGGVWYVAQEDAGEPAGAHARDSDIRPRHLPRRSGGADDLLLRGRRDTGSERVRGRVSRGLAAGHRAAR